MSEPLLQTSIDDVHVHAHKTGHTWVDLAVAVSAIAISITSLFVAVAHGRTEEKLLAANSWPFLTFSTSKNGLEAGGWTLDLRLQNSGVGPARVKWIRVVLDGKPVRNSVDLMNRCCGLVSGPIDEKVRLGLVSQNAPIGVLPAREGVDVLAWRQRRGNGALWAKLERAGDRLRTEACYCSVLADCWISDLTPTADPRPVSQCRNVSDGYSS